jgi:CubicO group peptidase (beta-lactamase class C family)
MIALAWAMSAFPATAGTFAADHVAAYVAAVNAGDAASVQRFRDTDVAPAFAQEQSASAFLRYFSEQHRVTGGVEMVDLRITPGLADLVLRDRIYGGLQGVRLTLEPGGAQRITHVEPGPAPAWTARRGPPLSSAALAARTRELMARGCAAGVFSGAVLVARGDSILAQAACGEASRRYHVTNTLETRFNLGSMNKMITAVAVMQLVEAGKLKLDDRLSTYADATWLAPEVARSITIGQLLTHTSGLGDFRDDGWSDKPSDAFRELADFKPLVRAETLAFEPGSKFEYSNTGMLMLGVVIEVVTGQAYDGYIRDHVLGPAGMVATDNAPIDEPVENRATGYQRAPGTPAGWRENTLGALYRGGPAGGGYSTVADLFRFGRALQTGKLVSPESLKVLWSDHPPNDYGAGFEVTSSTAGKVVGHSGAGPGVSGKLSLYLDEDYVVVVLANIDRAAPPLDNVLADEIAQAEP